MPRPRSIRAESRLLRPDLADRANVSQQVIDRPERDSPRQPVRIYFSGRFSSEKKYLSQYSANTRSAVSPSAHILWFACGVADRTVRHARARGDQRLLSLSSDDVCLTNI
jgi:hypothetical protein